MRIQLDKFLVATALLASGAVLGSGCTTEDTKTTTDAAVSGGGGSGGSTGGSGGTAGGTTGGSGGVAGGAAGSGGTAGGAAGSGGTAGGAAGATSCLGDGDQDAGFEGIDCTTLSYYADDCTDAGFEAPLGVDMCAWADANLRPDVADSMLSCLAAISVSDNCSAAHDTAVQACLDNVFPQACVKPLIDDGDGGLYDPCTDVSSFCPAVQLTGCQNTLNAVTDDSELAILDCWNNSNGSVCQDDWDACVALP
jgi:hypothetical protein